ncbi:MAG: hypothetical protein KA715_07895 [Xanthomonadaceae bacterium]|nr:hypothetical protein [Xanthomonadaceae bacterium]
MLKQGLFLLLLISQVSQAEDFSQYLTPELEQDKITAPLHKKLEKVKAKAAKTKKLHRAWAVCMDTGAAAVYHAMAIICTGREGAFAVVAIGFGFSLHAHLGLMVGHGFPGDGTYYGSSAGFWLGIGGNGISLGLDMSVNFYQVTRL